MSAQFFQAVTPLARRLAVSVAAVAALAAPVAAQAPSDLPAASGRNHAVLIAVQDFENSSAYPPLANTVNDMSALGDVLERRYGYEVTRLFNKDATLDRVVTELRERLPSRVREGDSVLVAFATHGKYSESDREGYLILQDTQNYKTGISLGNLNQYTKNQKMEKARAILFLLDACEMGKVETVEFRSVNVKPEVVMRKFRSIVTSAGYVRAADASPTNPLHSPFAEALISALDQDAKPKQLYDLLLDVSREVKNKTAGNQMPKQRKLPSDQDGDYLFQAASLVAAAAETRDGFDLIREQVAQTLRQVSQPGNEDARRRASAILIANKPMFDSMPPDLQREYVRLMTVAINPAAPEWKSEQAWVEEMLPRGGEMGKVKLAQLMIATGRSEAGVAMLEEVARPVATRSAAGQATNPSLRASAAAALLQLGAIKYDDWRKDRTYDAYAQAAVDRLSQAASLAQEAGQPQIAADIRLRVGHIHEEVARHGMSTMAAERPTQAAARLTQHGQGAIEAYVQAGVNGRKRLAQLKTWLNTEKTRLTRSRKPADATLAEATETLINSLIREETKL